MSEPQSQKWPAITATEWNTMPDDSEPTDERKAELRSVYEMNVAQGKPPYERVAIHTRGELTWVINERGWLRVDQDGEPSDMTLTGVNLIRANLSGVRFTPATLRGAKLQNANLSGADLYMADLREANLHGANLSGADLGEANFSGSDLREARMDANTRLALASLDKHTRLVDVVWNGVPLTRLNWRDIDMLGDEAEARDPRGKRPDDFFNWRYVSAMNDMRAPSRRSKGATRIKQALENTAHLSTLLAYEDAVTANRQVATVLRSQGMNEVADRFAYRAQVLQRRVFRYRQRWGAFIGSWLLDLIGGYGYKPIRSIITYLVVVVGFASIYFVFRDSVQPSLNPLDAIIFSITSFHGRGFSPGEAVTLHNPLTIFAALEAIIGLLIEITFIATFTQRFFAR